MLITCVFFVHNAQAQNTITKEVMVKNPNTSLKTPEIKLVFEGDVPVLSKDQISLLIEEKSILHSKKIKGVYVNPFEFVPRTQFTTVYLQDNTVKSSPPIIQDQNSLFPWFIVLGVVSILLIYVLKKTENRQLPSLFLVGAAAVAGGAAPVVAGVGATVAGGAAVAVAVTVAGAVTLAVGNKKFFSFLFYLFVVLMSLFLIFCYLQI